MTGPVPVPPIGLGVLLRDGHRAFQRAIQAELATAELTLGEWSHLRVLVDQDGLTQIAVCQRIGIQKASSTAVIDSLERRKLIRRVRNAADRRMYNIFITPHGRELCELARPRVTALNARARAGLTEEDAAALYRIMHTIIDNLSLTEQTPA